MQYGILWRGRFYRRGYTCPSVSPREETETQLCTQRALTRRTARAEGDWPVPSLGVRERVLGVGPHTEWAWFAPPAGAPGQSCRLVHQLAQVCARRAGGGSGKVSQPAEHHEADSGSSVASARITAS